MFEWWRKCRPLAWCVGVCRTVCAPMVAGSNLRTAALRLFWCLCLFVPFFLYHSSLPWLGWVISILDTATRVTLSEVYLENIAITNNYTHPTHPQKSVSNYSFGKVGHFVASSSIFPFSVLVWARPSASSSLSHSSFSPPCLLSLSALIDPLITWGPPSSSAPLRLRRGANLCSQRSTSSVRHQSVAGHGGSLPRPDICCFVVLIAIKGTCPSIKEAVERGRGNMFTA